MSLLITQEAVASRRRELDICANVHESIPHHAEVQAMLSTPPFREAFRLLELRVGAEQSLISWAHVPIVIPLGALAVLASLTMDAVQPAEKWSVRWFLEMVP